MADQSFTPQTANPQFIRGLITQPRPDVLDAPKNIINTVAAAKAYYYQYRFEHLSRIELYAGIEGLFSGNPPYNPNDLAKNRLSHITNYNDLTGRAWYERESLGLWNLLNEAEYNATWEIVPTATFGQATGDQLVEWAEIMSQHWDRVVRSWPSFNVMFNTLSGQLVKLGVSPALWPDERDWRWKTIELSRFFVQDQAQCDLDKLTCVCVESIFTAQYLWQVYEKFKDEPADKSPWNIEELVGLLLYFANQATKDQYNFVDMMDVQKVIQNRDMTFNQIFSDDIRLVNMLYQEYDGEITSYMFHPRWDCGSFLYMADRQYKCLQDALVIFTASPGEFTIHSNRGLGHKVYSPCTAMMQLNCSIVDMGRMSATPLIQTLATGEKDFSAIRFYPGVPTILGQAEFVENTLGANIQQVVGASQFTYARVEGNLSNNGDNPVSPDQSYGSLSPDQVRTQDYKEFSILKNNVAHFYTNFDCVIENMGIKMLHSKEGYPGYSYYDEWKQACLIDGVPDEVFKIVRPNRRGMPAHLRLKATRAAGGGSTMGKIRGLESLLPISPSFGPNEEREYKREWIIATMGPQYVRSFLQDSQNSEAASGGASLAGVENMGMQSGFSPIFSPDNEHRAHFEVHMGLGNDIIRRIQQQQLDPVDADKIFNVLVPHMEDHYKALQKNIFAKTFVEQVRKAWDQIQQYATLNRHNAAKELQAQIKKKAELEQQQQQQLSEQALKAQETQSKIQDNARKTDASIENQQKVTEAKAQLGQQKAQDDARNKTLKTSLEAQNKTVDQQQAQTNAEPLPQLRQDLSTINGQSPAPFDIENNT